MKKLNPFVLVMICINLLTVASCNKNNDDGISAGDGCTASWTVNGTNYSENDMTLCLYSSNTLNLSASASGGDFQLQIDPISGTGTYEADASNPDLNVVIIIRLNDGTQIGIKSGQIIVTELTTSKAKGTFSGSFFNLADLSQTPGYIVTNGKFESNF